MFDGIQVTNSFELQAEQIYRAYPLKVAKPVAILAIMRQLMGNKKKHVDPTSFDVLLERTTMFASAVSGTRDFIPHPSTWFNQQRFNDDPSTWVRHRGIGESKTQLAAVEALIASHVANPDSTSHKSNCTQSECDDLDQLKIRRYNIVKSIANH